MNLDASKPLVPGERISAMWIAITYDAEKIVSCDDFDTPALAEERAMSWCGMEVGRRAIVARVARRFNAKLSVESASVNEVSTREDPRR